MILIYDLPEVLAVISSDIRTARTEESSVPSQEASVQAMTKPVVSIIPTVRSRICDTSFIHFLISSIAFHLRMFPHFAKKLISARQSHFIFILSNTFHRHVAR